ncbi:MAG: nuclear transport factor 2 family protein, partial [Gammaproteobacteria bacterium]
MKTNVAIFGLAGLFLACAVAAADDEIGAISAMLDEFLAHAGEAQAHERFWAEDLVYTSSRGTRTDKAEIMASFDNAESAAERAAGPDYRAEDVDIRLYDDMAVLAFRLVGTATKESGETEVQNYFNTGTLQKRD